MRFYWRRIHSLVSVGGNVFATKCLRKKDFAEKVRASRIRLNINLFVFFSWMIYPSVVAFIVATITYPRGYGRFLSGRVIPFFILTKKIVLFNRIFSSINSRKQCWTFSRIVPGRSRFTRPNHHTDARLSNFNRYKNP